MLPRDQQTQRTFLQQECYLPILLDTFLTARKAEGLSKATLSYYREKLTVFLSFCEAQAVTQIQDVTPDLLRRYFAACESLAKVRKMKIPAMQLNIGDKQINVAGDLKPGTTEIINV